MQLKPAVNTFYTASRDEWRKWLSENFKEAKEIWLVYPKKLSGKDRILYNDAVEEALCFGWIDSTIRSLDEDYTIQKFSPRRRNSKYSQLNKERLSSLIQNSMVHPSIIEDVKEVISEEFVFPADIIDLLKQDKTVWTNYQKFSDSYKRIRIAYIDGARKIPDEFEKRLSHFIRKTKENKLIGGYGGTDKYYSVL